MSERNFPDWLSAYCQYASYSESPTKMHFWCGVSALAGALRRHVWIDMGYFNWYPNMYIILTAPPGVVTKSTTCSIAMDLLREVPGIIFGPESVTGPSLIDKFVEASEEFLVGEFYHKQSALTIQASELGNFLNPDDRNLVDWLVNLWDSRTGVVDKSTRGAGTQSFANPFLNIISCTTPGWLEGNMPRHMIGGGFTSRTIFVYADKKAKYVAYPKRSRPADLSRTKLKLVHDLQHIANKVCGEFEMTKEAEDWGDIWYKEHHQKPPVHLQDADFQYYLARKQAHLHKLAMVLCASRTDDLLITLEDLTLAYAALNEIEVDMPKVFANVGRSPASIRMEKFVDFIRKHPEGVPHDEAYRFIYLHFPSAHDFSDALAGAVQARLVKVVTTPQGMVIQPDYVPGE